MAQTVGDFLVNRLHDWGVRKTLGYPGDDINSVFGALNRAGGKIEFIQAWHEVMAAFMVSAYAKFAGKLGVCIATYPASWNEIGFGGPACRRGYVRRNFDRHDPWEAAEATPGREVEARKENERVG